MNDEYLWDKSGEPDPEIVRLEQLLSGFGHEQKPMRLARTWNWYRYAAAVALVAALVAAAGAWWFLPREPRTTWDVASVQGAPRVANVAIGKTGKLSSGESLETDAHAVARLEVGNIGEVTVDPNSRVTLVKSHENEHRLSLQRGVIHALIWAPPRQFFVDTPSAVAVDLGCRYTLKVDDSGDGLLTVETGWVAFEAHGRESFIPAGAACPTTRAAGPGLPYYLDSTTAFRNALLSGNTKAALAEARPHDAMTLWHMLSRVPQAQRAAVYTQMASMAPPPDGVTREGVLALRQPMMDQWWDSLGLDSANWWRRWKSDWRQ
ncbi:MAG: FecR domain-containing protein [Bryobacteraceae bacterium]